jgi:hypothetical protein
MFSVFLVFFRGKEINNQNENRRAEQRRDFALG